MILKTKKILKNHRKKKTIKYGGSNPNLNNFNNINNSINNKNNTEIVKIPEGDISKEQVDNQSYNFSKCRENISFQPYGDEIKLVLNKDDTIYGLNMNVISFDSSIKETKTFNAKSKFMNEELFIKKYICNKNDSKIIFDYDKNKSSEISKKEIICIELTNEKNTFISRNTKNVIAYTGNIKFGFEFHTTGIISSKENLTFLKLKLNKNSTSNGYVWMVVDNYKVENDNDNDSIKIKSENFICATMPEDGLKLHKVILGIRKSTREYFTVNGPYTVYRTSNDYSPKQKYMLLKYKTSNLEI